MAGVVIVWDRRTRPVTSLFNCELQQPNHTRQMFRFYKKCNKTLTSGQIYGHFLLYSSWNSEKAVDFAVKKKRHKSGRNHQLFLKLRLQTLKKIRQMLRMSWAWRMHAVCVLQMGGVVFICTIDQRQFAWNLFIQIDRKIDDEISKHRGMNIEFFYSNITQQSLRKCNF